MSAKFGKKLEGATARIIDKAEKRVKNLIGVTAREIIRRTPKDKGLLINNWYASKGGFPQGRNKSFDRSGKKSIARINKTVDSLKLGQTFYMANNLPYARVVEYGLYPNPPKNPTGKTVNGFSKQAPAGMVRINIRKLISKIRAGGAV